MDMSDFPAEGKPRPFVPYASHFAQEKEDFVAEVRPRSYREKSYLTQTSSPRPLLDESDLYLQKVLSDGHFSRGGITRLLQGSIISLIETILTGRSITSIEGSLQISLSSSECPLLINLYKRFPGSPAQDCLQQQAFETSLNIKIRDRGNFYRSPSSEQRDRSCSPCFDYNRETCHSPTGSDSSLQMSLGYHSDRDNSLTSPPHDSCLYSNSRERHTSRLTSEGSLSSPTTQESSLITVQQHSKSSLPPPTPEASVPAEKDTILSEKDTIFPKIQGTSNSSNNEMSDSDQPSYSPKHDLGSDGLTSHESQTFNDFYQGPASTSSPTPANINTPESDSCGPFEDGSDEMDDENDDVESEPILVIDENPQENASKPNQVNSDVDDVSRDHQKDGFPESLIDEMKDVRCAANSDYTDIDTQGYVPRNSDVAADISSLTSRPQCERPKRQQCCKVLPESSVVSPHAQAGHDLDRCTFCCRTFTTKSNLKRHLRRHTGQRPYKCLQCSQSFFRRGDLKAHVVRHEHTKPSRRGDLKAHAIRHEHIKPFRRSVCKQAYTDRASTKNHTTKQYRSGATEVRLRCGESFKGEDASTFHKRSHPELKQFSCSKCSFNGTDKLTSLKHSLIHSRKVFSCKSCHANFVDPFHYTAHVKKHRRSPTFDQYICSFCDLALASYDQYIRHEYSHAESKVHASKSYKKQFRGNHLHQDHAKAPGSPEDRPQAPMRPSDDGPITNCYSRIWGPLSDKENRLSSSRNYFPLGSDDVSLEYSNQCQLKLSLPTTVVESEEDEEPWGQLLDLSMKKAPEVAGEGQSKAGTCSPFIRSAGQLKNFSRNGAVEADPAGLSQSCQVKSQGFTSGQSAENLHVARSPFIMTDQVTPRRRVSNVSHYISSSPSKRPRNQSPSADSRIAHAPSLDRIVLSNDSLNGKQNRPPVRIIPYSREKMADLAAKFMAARGTRLTGPREPLKAIIPVGDERAAIIIKDQNARKAKLASVARVSNLQPVSNEQVVGENGRRTLACEGVKDHAEVGRDNTNLETTLCHMPTVVKSEPLPVQSELPESPLDCRLHRATPFVGTEARVTEARVTETSRHSCEICRVVFGSFVELEAHSVEAHKRYLCEHCRKSFTARPNRDRHVRYHTGERPYSCDLCDLSFFRGDDLKYHRTTRHPTAQPFVCTRCSATFTWGRDLERHIRHSKCNV